MIETLERATRRPPVVMATPASFALHVPRTWSFDLLVVDEASLVPLVEALPAVAACGQVVICGDSRQMQKDPPLWVLFDPERPYVPAPTLIEAAIEAGIPRSALSHHYRSLHPGLMHASNRMFYRGLMRMSGGPRTDDALGYGAVTLEGCFSWETLTNPDEAEAVVDALERHLASGRTTSVGIVAMTMQQRDLIRRRIVERGLDLSRVTGRESLLVADYNGIQGEERDVVLISFTFGRREGEAAWPTGYGAISLPGGERRLDVIMTRARQRMVAFTSFPAESIDAGACLGHDALLTYLLAARHAPVEEPDPYEGVMSEVLRRNAWRGVSLGNAIGVVNARTEEYVAALFVTGTIDPLTERSEKIQFRNAGWQVLEVAREEAVAAESDLVLRHALAKRLVAELRAAEAA